MTMNILGAVLFAATFLIAVLSIIFLHIKK